MNYKIKAHAKINIGLNIIGKRDDGYHDLETIFYPVKLFDEIEFQDSNHFSFETENQMLAGESNNLIVEAVRLFEKETEIKINMRIKLHKNIPIGAGLGGGSSDAAATLNALNKIYKHNLSPKQLIDFALRLGSDIPFFIESKTSFAQSRGEILNRLNIAIKKPLLIINPGIHISTGWAFENIKPVPPKKSLATLTEIDFENISLLKDIITNDFEKPVFKKYPEIALIKDQIYKSGAEFALMTGTGSTVFGIFKNLGDAKNALNTFNKKYFRFIDYET